MDFQGEEAPRLPGSSVGQNCSLSGPLGSPLCTLHPPKSWEARCREKVLVLPSRDLGLGRKQGTREKEEREEEPP